MATAATLTQAIANMHKEVQNAHEFIWNKGVRYLLIAWLAILMLLLLGMSSFALVASYGILITCYFYLTKPGMIEAVAIWSLIVSAKEGDVELETALPAMTGKIQGILLNAFILIFITPCTIGFLLPDMSLLTALTLVAFGAGCGILNVQKLQWEGKGFYRFIFALSIGEIVSIVAMVVNFGNTENAIAATKLVREYYWLCGSIAFVIAMGYFGLIATKTTDGVKKTFGVIAWMITHPFKLLWIILFITIACAIFWPQSLVMGSKFIKDQQAIALIDAKKAGLDIPEVKLPESKDAPVEKASEEKVKPSTEPVGGVVVAGEIKEIPAIEGCDTNKLPIATKEFKTDKTTFGNLPTLATIEPGKYLVTAEGERCQDFYSQGGTSPLYCRLKDADGNTLDDPTLAKFFVKDEPTRKMMPLSDMAYSLFLIFVNGKNVAAGKSHYFSTDETVTLQMNLNVPQEKYSYTSTGGFIIKLYKCK